jgi:molybdopterin synthase sulfur carrier subunit
MAVIKFFASLREQLNTSEVAISVEEFTGHPTATISELVAAMAAKDSQWEALQASHLLIALNQTMSSRDAIVREGDELAFFPAVTGG